VSVPRVIDDSHQQQQQHREGDVRDVLAVGELEKVLLAVDDGEGAIGIPPANVAREEPAIPEALRTGGGAHRTCV
jgi:hypothetical protein